MSRVGAGYGARTPIVYGGMSIVEAGVFKATSVAVTDGTIAAGDVDSTKQINQVYLQVTESGQFKIDFTVTGLTNDPAMFVHVGRYQGSNAHNVFAYAWNYVGLVWDRLTTAANDFPSSTEDYSVSIVFPNDSSMYRSAGEAKIRIEHDSAAVGTHNFYTDMFELMVESATFPTPGAYVTMTGATTGPSQNMTVDGTNGTFTVGTTGTYEFDGYFSIAGTPDAAFHGHIAVNGTVYEPIGGALQFDSTGRVRPVSMGGMVALNAGDVVTVKIASLNQNAFLAMQYVNCSLKIAN